MTLLVVLLMGLGTVLVVSAVETDPTTGKSVSITETIGQIWNNQIDFAQPAGPPAAQSGGGGGAVPTDPQNPAWTTSLSPNTMLSYQQAATQNYVQGQQH